MKPLQLLLKNRDRVLNSLIYACLFLFLLYPYRDYDWGWHYRLGEFFFKHGHIMYHDIFSSTMQGYVWINHEWLYDPLVYVLFNATSFWGLSVAGAIVLLLAFYFCVKGIKVKPYMLAILAFLFGYLTSGVAWQGLRSQIIALLLIAINMYLLRLVEKGNKKIYLVFPVLYLLWVNLHGTFIFGLLIFGLFVIQKLAIDSRRKDKMYFGKNELYLLASFLVSIAVTFINTFGIGVYFEALRHFGNPLLKYIVEWDPVEFPSTFYLMMITFALLFLFTVAMEYRKVKKLNIYMLGVGMLTFYLAYGARRYVAVAVVVVAPFIALYFQDVRIHIEKFKTTSMLLCLSIVIALEISIFRRIIPWKIFNNYSYKEYCFFGPNCSEGLTAYLLAHPPQGQGLSFYDWGGYLIGRGVPAKLFIDGRMHLWENPDHYQVFLEYQKIYYEGDIKRFDSYNFSWVIVPRKSYMHAYIVLKKVKGIWVNKYEDDNAVYYVRDRGNTQIKNADYRRKK